MNLIHRDEALLGGQHGCPTGLGGWIISKRMVRQHEPETLWTLSLLEIRQVDSVLEIGFGAGRAIELIAEQVTKGHVAGIDLSGAMVQAASRHNAHAVRSGQVTLQQGDVTSLPFADQHFDKIMSIHSLYFWPDPVRAITEIKRVLKPGGQLALTLSPGIVGAEADASYQTMVNEHVLPAMKHLGFASAYVKTGPNSRHYQTVAVMGVK